MTTFTQIHCGSTSEAAIQRRLMTTRPLRIPHCGAWCVNQVFFIWRRALARGLLSQETGHEMNRCVLHNKRYFILQYIFTYILGGIFMYIIYICLGVALNRRCAFQARENGGKLFFTMSLWIIWLNEMRVWSTVDDPHPPLTWRSSGIKGHFQHVFRPQWRSIPPS